MSAETPEVRLDRILTALGLEVAEATDEEMLAAAAEIGMKPMMRGSAAFIGLKHFVVPYRAELFVEHEEMSASLLPWLARKPRDVD